MSHSSATGSKNPLLFLDGPPRCFLFLIKFAGSTLEKSLEKSLARFAGFPLCISWTIAWFAVYICSAFSPEISAICRINRKRFCSTPLSSPRLSSRFSFLANA